MELDIRPAWRNYWISLGLCGLFLISFVGSPATPDGTNWAAFWLAALMFGIAGPGSCSWH